MQREVLLWNFTVLAEASAQLDTEFKKRDPHIDWARPVLLHNRIMQQSGSRHSAGARSSLSSPSREDLFGCRVR